MKDIYSLVKTVLISEAGNVDASIKYDIYRGDDGVNDRWHVMPSKQMNVETKDGMHAVWVNLASKSFSGYEELENVLSECQSHYQENL